MLNKYDTKFLKEKMKISVDNILYIYRYFTLFVTSIYYLSTNQNAIIACKISVVVFLSIAAKNITDLYMQNKDNVEYLKIATFTETFCIALLLLPTGGISSPFFWYALNPILLGTIQLNGIFRWVNLLLYSTMSFLISIFFYMSKGYSLSILFRQNLYTVLTLVLITLAVYLLASFVGDLKKQKEELVLMNNKLIESNKAECSIEHIMSLYNAIALYTNQDDFKKFLKSIIGILTKVAKDKFIFIYIDDFKNEIELIISNDNSIQSNYKAVISRTWKSIKTNNISGEEIIEETLSIYPIRTKFKLYGLIGVEEGKNCEELKDYIKFLSQLCGDTFNRLMLEESSSEILVAKEQDRIAEEIHDGVAQMLFSISCATYTLKFKWKNLSPEEIDKQLNLINKTSKCAMNELRDIVYNISSTKKGANYLAISLKKHLNDIAKLNNVKINFNIEGKEALLSSDIKNIIYRVIFESSGNAIKHGNCSRLDIKIEIDDSYTTINVIDNGKGFNINDIDKKSGLGINNINKLVTKYNGIFTIDSSLDQGTKINVILVNSKNIELKDAVV
jgi:signal transduction histidine kinase